MPHGAHILSDTWLTRGLSVEEAEQLLRRCTLRVLQPGEQLFAAGSASQEVWFLRSGTLAFSADGVKPAAPVTVKHPATVCDISLLAPGPHSVTATATEPARLYGLSHAAFLELRLAAPGCAAKLLRTIAPTLAARLRECNDRAESATVEKQLDVAVPGAAGPGGHLQAMADQLLAEGSRAPSTTRMPSQATAGPPAKPAERPARETQKTEIGPEGAGGMFGRLRQAIGGKPDSKGKP